MRESLVVTVLALLCITFAGCESTGKSESLQPDVVINYVEDNDTNSSGISEVPDKMSAPDTSNEPDTADASDTPENSDYSEADNNDSRNSKYTLASLASGDIAIISGSEYDPNETNIHGSVLGIGKYTVILNKAFTAEYTPDGKYVDENTMVSLEDPDEQIRGYVQFTEESTFTLRETRNSGADVKDSSTAFEDIKMGDLLDASGYYTDGIFNAINTIIYRNLDTQ